MTLVPSLKHLIPNNLFLVVGWLISTLENNQSLKKIFYLVFSFYIIGNIVSIAFFNFAGISVTKELSATTRMVLDSVRTLVIWVVTLGLMWQDFQYLQLVGFFILLSGMCLYNNIIIVPAVRYCQERRRTGQAMGNVGEERDRLINSAGRSSVKSSLSSDRCLSVIIGLLH